MDEMSNLQNEIYETLEVQVAKILVRKLVLILGIDHFDDLLYIFSFKRFKLKKLKIIQESINLRQTHAVLLLL